MLAIHKSDPAHIARQRVVPHIKDMLRIIRPRNPPLDGFSADRNILQPTLNETLHLVESKIRIQKLRMILVEIEQLLLVGRKPEKIIFLGDKLPRTPANLAVRRFRRIAHVEVVVDAVPAFILSFVNRVGRNSHRPPHQILYRKRMTRLSRADKASGRNSQQLPQIPKNLLVLIHKLLRRHLRLFRRPLDVHPMLVRPRQVRHVVAAHALVARDHVAHNRCIRRPDVRPRVRIINRCGDVKLRLRHSVFFSYSF